MLHPIEIAQQKQMKAKECIKEFNFEEAILLFQEALKIKETLVDVPPFVCIVDISSLHLAIGDALRLRWQTSLLSSSRALDLAIGFEKDKSKKDNKAKIVSMPIAIQHYRTAWSMLQHHFGTDHPMTRDAQRQYILVSAAVDALTTAATPAAFTDTVHYDRQVSESEGSCSCSCISTSAPAA